MKRIFTFLLILVSVFVLIGCDKDEKDPDIKDPKDEDVLEVSKNNIKETLEKYYKNNYGHVKFEEGTADELLVTELAFAFKLNDDEELIVDEYMLKQIDGDQVELIYIKDGYSYSDYHGQKVKQKVEPSPEDQLRNYGIQKYFDLILARLDDNFFKALEEKSVDKGKEVRLLLNLEAYEGTEINVDVISEYEIVIKYASGKITAIEEIVTRDDVKHYIRTKFLSFDKPEIEFPSDLSEYK